LCTEELKHGRRGRRITGRKATRCSPWPSKRCAPSVIQGGLMPLHAYTIVSGQKGGRA
jgi:hypothetical protein